MSPPRLSLRMGDRRGRPGAEDESEYNAEEADDVEATRECCDCICNDICVEEEMELLLTCVDTPLCFSSGSLIPRFAMWFVRAAVEDMS